MTTLLHKALPVGSRVLLHTVTHNWEGTVSEVDMTAVLLTDCIWIGDEGDPAKPGKYATSSKVPGSVTIALEHISSIRAR
jgi:hypothetical protein